MAQLAGHDISRAFVHQLEHGQSKPSKDTLLLIARRTGKPIDYFIRGAPTVGDTAAEVAANLARLQRPLRTIAATASLTETQRDSLDQLELSMRRSSNHFHH